MILLWIFQFSVKKKNYKNYILYRLKFASISYRYIDIKSKSKYIITRVLLFSPFSHCHPHPHLTLTIPYWTVDVLSSPALFSFFPLLSPHPRLRPGT